MAKRKNDRNDPEDQKKSPNQNNESVTGTKESKDLSVNAAESVTQSAGSESVSAAAPSANKETPAASVKSPDSKAADSAGLQNDNVVISSDTKSSTADMTSVILRAAEAERDRMPDPNEKGITTAEKAQRRARIAMAEDKINSLREEAAAARKNNAAGENPSLTPVTGSDPEGDAAVRARVEARMKEHRKKQAAEKQSAPSAAAATTKQSAAETADKAPAEPTADKPSISKINDHIITSYGKQNTVMPDFKKERSEQDAMAAAAASDNSEAERRAIIKAQIEAMQRKQNERFLHKKPEAPAAAKSENTAAAAATAESGPVATASAAVKQSSENIVSAPKENTAPAVSADNSSAKAGSSFSPAAAGTKSENASAAADSSLNFAPDRVERKAEKAESETYLQKETGSSVIETSRELHELNAGRHQEPTRVSTLITGSGAEDLQRRYDEKIAAVAENNNIPEIPRANSDGSGGFEPASLPTADFSEIEDIYSDMSGYDGLAGSVPQDNRSLMHMQQKAELMQHQESENIYRVGPSADRRVLPEESQPMYIQDNGETGPYAVGNKSRRMTAEEVEAFRNSHADRRNGYPEETQDAYEASQQSQSVYPGVYAAQYGNRNAAVQQQVQQRQQQMQQMQPESQYAEEEPPLYLTPGQSSEEYLLAREQRRQRQLQRMREQDEFSHMAAGMEDGLFSSVMGVDTAGRNNSEPVYAVGQSRRVHPTPAREDEAPIYAVGAGRLNAKVEARLNADRMMLESEESAALYQNNMPENPDSSEVPYMGSELQSEELPAAPQRMSREQMRPAEDSEKLMQRAYGSKLNERVAEENIAVSAAAVSDSENYAAQEESESYHEIPVRKAERKESPAGSFFRKLAASFFCFSSLSLICRKTADSLGSSAPGFSWIPVLFISFIAAFSGRLINGILSSDGLPQNGAAITVLISVLLSGIASYRGLSLLFVRMSGKENDTVISSVTVTLSLLALFCLTDMLFAVCSKGFIEPVLSFTAAAALSAAAASTLTAGSDSDSAEPDSVLSVAGLFFIVLLCALICFFVFDPYNAGLSVFGVVLSVRLIFGYMISDSAKQSDRKLTAALQLLIFMSVLAALIIAKSTDKQLINSYILSALQSQSAAQTGFIN